MSQGYVKFNLGLDLWCIFGGNLYAVCEIKLKFQFESNFLSDTPYILDLTGRDMTALPRAPVTCKYNYYQISAK